MLIRNNVSYHSLTREESTTPARGKVAYGINTGVQPQKCIVTVISTVQVGYKLAYEPISLC